MIFEFYLAAFESPELERFEGENTQN